MEQEEDRKNLFKVVGEQVSQLFSKTNRSLLTVLIIGFVTVAVIGSFSLFSQKPTTRNEEEVSITNQGKTIDSGMKYEGVPTTYAECMQTTEKYHPYDEPTPLECKYEVSQEEANSFSKCKKLGGFIVRGPIVDFVSQPDFPDVCKLEFYNPNFVFPKTFEECLKVWPQSSRGGFEQRGTCHVSVEGAVFRINDKEVGDFLLQKCISAGGSYVDYPNPRFKETKCIIEFTEGENKNKDTQTNTEGKIFYKAGAPQVFTVFTEPKGVINPNDIQPFRLYVHWQGVGDWRDPKTQETYLKICKGGERGTFTEDCIGDPIFRSEVASNSPHHFSVPALSNSLNPQFFLCGVQTNGCVNITNKIQFYDYIGLGGTAPIEITKFDITPKTMEVGTKSTLSLAWRNEQPLLRTTLVVCRSEYVFSNSKELLTHWPPSCANLVLQEPWMKREDAEISFTDQFRPGSPGYTQENIKLYAFVCNEEGGCSKSKSTVFTVYPPPPI